jgi:hypothetical protein
MSEFFDLILSNRIYLFIAICIVGGIIFFIIKKMIKFIIYAIIILAAFLAYLHYSGDSVNPTIEPVEQAVKKVK